MGVRQEVRVVDIVRLIRPQTSNQTTRDHTSVRGTTANDGTSSGVYDQTNDSRPSSVLVHGFMQSPSVIGAQLAAAGTSTHR